MTWMFVGTTTLGYRPSTRSASTEGVAGGYTGGMMRLSAILLFVLVLTACSPEFSVAVDDFSTPIASSLGQVCWVEVDASGAPAISTATFRANATYDPDSLPTLTERVELQIFGRGDRPEAPCTGQDDETDVPLSQPLELEREVAQPIEVGGSVYGTELAGFVNMGTFWLGASAAGNVATGEEVVHFEDGRITVGF